MVNFTKMHGIGNDFIVISTINDENIISKNKIPSIARYLCDRHFGVGADGVIFIEKSKIADFKMCIYNKDGSEAQMCGNGIRCLAKYVYEKGLTDKKNIDIETLDGVKQAYLRIEKDEVTEITICMGSPIFDLQKLKQINFLSKNCDSEIIVESKDKKFEIFPVSMGNPHAVIFEENVEEFNIMKYGKNIENNNLFPEKVNVEFVQWIDKGHIKIRVWERGSGETYACGTGACAAASICIAKGFTRRNVIVNLKGGDLVINWSPQDNQIYMTGIATKVFDGKIT